MNVRLTTHSEDECSSIYLMDPEDRFRVGDIYELKLIRRKYKEGNKEDDNNKLFIDDLLEEESLS